MTILWLVIGVGYTCKQIFGLCHSPPWLENQIGLQKIKNLLEKKNILCWVNVSIQKPDMQEKRMLLCNIYMVCDRKKHKLSMDRETWGFDCVIRPLCCFWSALLSHHSNYVLLHETPIVLSSKNCDRPSIMFRQTECYCGVFMPFSLYQCLHQSCDRDFLRV